MDLLFTVKLSPDTLSLESCSLFNPFMKPWSAWLSLTKFALREVITNNLFDSGGRYGGVKTPSQDCESALSRIVSYILCELCNSLVLTSQTYCLITGILRITIILKLAQLTIYLVAHRILLVFSSLIDIAITGILATKIYRNFKIGQPGMMGDALWAVGSLRYQPTDLNSRTPEIPENVELVKPVVPLATLQLT